MHAKIEQIGIAPGEGQPLELRPEVELVAGVGIAGDRYAVGDGTWSDPKYADKQLTFVEAEVAERVGFPAEAFRRNVVTRGIVLEELIGKTFRIGDTRIRGVRPCDPCAYLEGLLRPGLVRDMVGKGGLRAEILVGGAIHVGDTITVE
jgi:hypothetical protein